MTPCPLIDLETLVTHDLLAAGWPMTRIARVLRTSDGRIRSLRGRRADRAILEPAPCARNRVLNRSYIHVP